MFDSRLIGSRSRLPRGLQKKLAEPDQEFSRSVHLVGDGLPGESIEGKLRTSEKLCRSKVSKMTLMMKKTDPAL